MLPPVSLGIYLPAIEGCANTLGARLSDNARAREALRQCLPEPLRDATFSSVLRDDAATKRCLAQLLINLSDNVVDQTSSVHPGL
jgi:CCR4-NOT transcription complex subunit 9